MRLNANFGDRLKVTFEALGCEDKPIWARQRSHGIINQDVDRADVFFLVLHRRWGRYALDDQPYSSHTEEEFHRAFDRRKREGKPEIFVFFKHITPCEMGDPGSRLRKVLAFRRELEESRQVISLQFATVFEFKFEIEQQLLGYFWESLPKAEHPRPY